MTFFLSYVVRASPNVTLQFTVWAQRRGPVLLGQVLPEGAPPFARVVNILFLVLSLAYFLNALWRVRRSR